MAITLAASLGRTFHLAADAATAFAVLSDIPIWAAWFPRTERAEPLSDGVYRWMLRPFGPPRYAVRPIYTCRYTADPATRALTWVPVPDPAANTRFVGAVRLLPVGPETAGALRLQAEFDLPISPWLRVLVQPAVKYELGQMTDQFIANLRSTFG